MSDETIVKLVAELAGIFAPSGDLNTEWFRNPFGEEDDLMTILTDSNQVKALFDLSGEILNPSPDQPAIPGVSGIWYPIPDPIDGTATGVCLVMPPPGGGEGQLGFGAQHDAVLDGLSVTIYLYVAILKISPPQNPSLILSKTPPMVGIQINNATSMGKPEISTVSLDAILDPDTPSFNLSFYKSGSTEPVQTFSSLESLLKDQTYVDILGDEIIHSDMMQYWLNQLIGQSGTTHGDLLAAAGLLDQSGTSNTVYTLDTQFLTALENKSPKGIVEQLVHAALTGLSAVQPLIPLHGGGISIVEESAGSNHFGINVQIPDLMLKHADAASQKELLLQLGKWLTGGTDDDNWITQSGLSGPVAGLNLFFINSTSSSFSLMSNPTLELISVGVDYRGTNSKHPLFDSKGVTLQGAEARIYLKTDFAKLEQFGAAVRLNEIGIPLGPPAGINNASNPVAGNILSSGAGSNNGIDSGVAVNPTISIVTSYLNQTFHFQMYDAQGRPTDTVWLPLQRTFGPLKCQKIGVGWQSDTKDLLMIFDGSIELGGLVVDLIDLSIGIPITDPAEVSNYELGLKGLNLLYEKGSVRISGGFMQSGSGDSVVYNGEAILDVNEFGVGAVGSYGTTENGEVSLFIFASTTTPLGGPPAFFIDGLAAGFGYNRKLVPPARDRVLQFPLVAAAANPSALGLSPGSSIQPDQLSGILSTFSSAVPISIGDFWFAAGVKFISFDLVYTNVLLALIFSKDFEILILGSSTVQLPPPPDNGNPFAFAELEIEVTIEPSKGSVEATAILAPGSYVLTPDCHLTGGFAFCTWFGSNPHAGDFVLTLGGYHPAFKKPSWYPDVPRLGFSWDISSDLSIDGDAYFALTPSCIMGGGTLDASFHMGSFLHAWFTALANFLITWKPFHYDIGIGVSIGVRASVPLLFVTLHITLSVGATINIWGPSTGGKAHVHLWFVSFTIAFGPGRTSIGHTVDWAGFSSMLPKSSHGSDTQTSQRSSMSNVMMVDAAETDPGQNAPAKEIAPVIVIQSGLVSTDETTGDWTVRGADFMFSTNSAVPCSGIVLGSDSQFIGKDTLKLTPEEGAETTIRIRPMGLDGVTSEYSICLKADSSNADEDDLSYHHWVFQSQYQDLPEALWGTPIAGGSTPPLAANMVHCMVGLENITPKSHIPVGPPPVDLQKAFTDVPVMMSPDDYPDLPVSADAIPTGCIPSLSPRAYSELGGIYNKTAPTTAQANRADLITALGGMGLYQQDLPGDLSMLANDPQGVFQNAPMIDYTSG